MPKKNRVLCLFEDTDIEIIQDLASLDGEGFNAALRKIIREWSRVNQKGTVVIGGNGSDHEQN